MKASSHILCSCPKTLHFSQITDTSNDLLWMTPPSAHWYGPTLEKERQIGLYQFQLIALAAWSPMLKIL